MHYSAHHVLACAVLLLAVSARSARAQHDRDRADGIAPCPPRDSMPVYRPDTSRMTPIPRKRAPRRTPLDSAPPRAPRGAVLPRDNMPTLRPDTSRFRMPRLVPHAREHTLPRDSVVEERRDCW
jgi:hypothetical protein